jgi:hypothetical protein
MVAVLEGRRVPRRKLKPDRDRFEVRADAEWIRRVDAAASRWGLSLSAYVRMVVTERMERDESQPPPGKKGGK